MFVRLIFASVKACKLPTSPVGQSRVAIVVDGGLRRGVVGIQPRVKSLRSSYTALYPQRCGKGS